MSRLARVATLLALPAKVVEELLHAAPLWPWADRIGVWIEPGTGDAVCEAVVPDAPDRVLWLSTHLPRIAGAALALAAVAAVASGARPESPLELCGTIAATWWWSRLVAPEREGDAGEGGT